MLPKRTKRVGTWIGIAGLSAVAACSFDSADTTEKSAAKSDGIINGDPFFPDADPANSGVTGIMRTNGAGDLSFVGSAVVIAGRKWLLTAAHVVAPFLGDPPSPEDIEMPASEDLDGTKVMLGGLREAWWLGDRDAGKVPTYGEHAVSQVIFHPDWDRLVNFDNPSPLIDIALVRTKNVLPINWASQQGDINLYPGDTEKLVGQQCFSLGFGLGVDAPDPDTTQVLRYGFFTILGVLGAGSGSRPGSLFAADARDISPGVVQSLAPGDSCSPCFDKQGRVAGILEGAQPGQFGTYTKTERYRRWAARVISETHERDFIADAQVTDNQSDVFARSRSTGDVYGLSARRAPDNSLDIDFGQPDGLLSANGWRVIGTGNFDQDEQADFVFQCLDPAPAPPPGGCTDPLGMVGFWLSGPGVFLRARPPSQTTWDIAAVADLDGDRNSDLIWRNRVDGRMVYWRVNTLDAGTAPADTILPSKAFTAWPTPLGQDWQIAVVADFDRYEFLNPEFAIRDTPDILWRNTLTGDNRLALMDYNAGTYGLRRTQTIIERPANFRAAGVGDYDLDGWADILWQCDTGPCNGGPADVEVMVRLNPHGPTTPDPAQPWRNFEFTALAGRCRAADGSVSACQLATADLEIFGPG